MAGNRRNPALTKSFVRPERSVRLSKQIDGGRVQLVGNRLVCVIPVAPIVLHHPRESYGGPKEESANDSSNHSLPKHDSPAAKQRQDKEKHEDIGEKFRDVVPEGEARNHD